MRCQGGKQARCRFRSVGCWQQTTAWLVLAEAGQGWAAAAGWGGVRAAQPCKHRGAKHESKEEQQGANRWGCAPGNLQLSTVAMAAPKAKWLDSGASRWQGAGLARKFARQEAACPGLSATLMRWPCNLRA